MEYILDSDLVVGFNHISFDWRVLLGIDKSVAVESTMPLISKPQYDVLVEVRKASGAKPFVKGHKLDQIAQVNLKRNKRMSGDLAPIAWKAGRVCDVIDYCIDDVALTRDLFEIALDRGDFYDPITMKKIYLPDPEIFVRDWVARQV
jgi:DEAD/DEAH box helicase domain-containing protein